MRLNLQQGLNELRHQSAALNLAEAKTRQLVDVLAIDALAELRSYLERALVRTEVAQLDILWEEKARAGSGEIDDLLSQQREAVRERRTKL